MMGRGTRFFGSLFPLLALVFALASPAAAQDEAEARMDAMIQELEALMQRGESRREADPWFLQDMQDIIARYRNVWSVELYSQRFTGRDSRLVPEPWQIAAGQFGVDYQLGLRAVVRPPRTAGGSQPMSNEEAVGQLLGSILGQALGTNQQQQQQQQGDEVAAAILPLRVSNAFSIASEVSLRAMTGGAGRVVMGVYQGEPSGPGYRLVYLPAAAPGQNVFELLRKSGRGTLSLIASYNGDLRMEDGRPHALLWTRDTSGGMEVSVDGQVLMSAEDRSFRDPFDGLTLINGGGDFALAAVKIDGTP